MRLPLRIASGLCVTLGVLFTAAAFAQPPARPPANATPVRTDGSATVNSDGSVELYGSSAGSAPLRIAPGELLVKFRGPTTRAGITNALNRALVRSAREYRIVPGLQRVRLAPGVAVEDAIAELKGRADVEYAEPNYLLYKAAVPNDPQFSAQWALHNSGQTSGFDDADIDAPEAWDVTTGSNTIVVAVIDTGVDYTHEDLAANIYRNIAECTANGVDDDGNGYVDDCHGIDTVNDDSDPLDDEGHGTHVAGIIGAVGNNGIGIAGVAWNVRLLPCKFMDDIGVGTTADVIECLEYVAMMKDRGVNIVATNNSWGGGPYSEAVLQAIAAQRQRGILFVAAAGNAGADHDIAQIYPCSYDAPNLLCVAAFTEFDIRPVFSDKGLHTVHVGAPGFDVLSTMPGNTYAEQTGTSMAAPHVAGVAALLKANDATRDWRAIKNLIIAGGELRKSMQPTISGRIASARGSLSCVNIPVSRRLEPHGLFVPMRRVGVPVVLRALNINCAAPAGAVSVTVAPTNEVLDLRDDGLGVDTVAGDGIYSTSWTELTSGTFTLQFPNNDPVPAVFDANLEPGFPLQTFSFGGTFLSGARIHTLVGNIDDDPELEILRTSVAAGPLYAWNSDGSAVPGWPRTITDATGTYLDAEGVAYPVLGNFAGGSQKLEVFANNNWLTKAAYDGNAAQLPGWPLRTYSQNPGSALDVDGNGIDEIVTEDNDDYTTSWLIVHRADGTMLPGWPVTLPPYSAASNPRTPALADLDGDGDTEIVTTDNQRVYAYNLDGTVVDGFPRDIPTGVESFATVGDVDGDGAPEIVLTSRSQDAGHLLRIYLVSAGGQIEGTFVTGFESIYDTQPTLADLTSDGFPEIILQIEAGSTGYSGLEVRRGDGTLLPGWPVSLLRWRVNSAPVVGDVNGDGSPEIVITTQLPAYGDGSDVRAYDTTGQLLPGFPKSVEVGGGAMPAIADIDHDGRNELVVTGTYWPGYRGQYDTVWVFDLGGPTPHGPIEWGQFMNDERHTGYYETGKNLPSSAYLSVRVSGAGSLRSAAVGIDCTADCIKQLSKGTSVTLTATPANGASFVRWGGACSGQVGDCTVAVHKHTSAFAEFTRLAYPVSVSIPNQLLGSVTSSPGGISCPIDCTEQFATGSQVTLTAVPAFNGLFMGWSGACSGTATTCVVTVNAAKSVVATFVPKIRLSVQVSGAGSVTSSVPAGTVCTADCTEFYPPDTAVTLTATAGSDSAFAGWFGSCDGMSPQCTVTTNIDKNVAASFVPKTALTVTVNGTGSGTVTTTPPGSSCSSTCNTHYDPSATVTLTAAPASNSVFTGWDGACTGAAPTCTVTMSVARSVFATFALQPTLTVTIVGSGLGQVTSQPPGSVCATSCSSTHQTNSIVTLTANAGASSTFTGWSGACSGTSATCSVTMNADKTAVATFVAAVGARATLTVSLSGSGAGSVTSTGAGIACGTDCSEIYDLNTQVTLSAAPAADSVFVAWTGACTGSVPSCSTTLNASSSVTAIFARKIALAVAITGGGSVTSAPAGIDCGADCSEAYAPNTVVSVTALATQGNVFDSWSGACAGQGNPCSVTVDATKSVGATFRAAPAPVPSAPPPASSSGGGGGGGSTDLLWLSLLCWLLVLRRRNRRGIAPR
jgi:thermitase